MNKLCVIGLGYIGLPTASLFARSGCSVLGVDVNEAVVESLNKGQVLIKEEGLNQLVAEVIDQGFLSASTQVQPADVFIITVPTPIHEDKTANLDYVIQASEAILPHIQPGNVVIVESTIPPRTMYDVVGPIFQNKGWDLNSEIFLAHCPERVLPGKILQELIHNTRIVGGYNAESASRAAEVYRQVVKGEIIETTALTAEMTKLMENTYRDVNIALANELAKISSHLGVNTLDVIELANQHPRVNLHQPGPGVGGHCIAIDPYFIIEKSPEHSQMMQVAREINESMPLFVVEQVQRLVPTAGAKIAVLGLTYKGNIDDTRESPAFPIIRLLEEQGYYINVHDPYVKQDSVSYELKDFKAAVQDASCLLVLTDHNEFKQLPEKDIIQLMENPIVFDTKNCVRINSEIIQYYHYNNLYEG